MEWSVLYSDLASLEQDSLPVLEEDEQVACIQSEKFCDLFRDGSLRFS